MDSDEGPADEASESGDSEAADRSAPAAEQSATRNVQIGRAIVVRHHYPCLICSDLQDRTTWKPAATRARGVRTAGSANWDRVCADVCFAAWLQQRSAAPAALPSSTRKRKSAQDVVPTTKNAGDVKAAKASQQAAKDALDERTGTFCPEAQKRLALHHVLQLLQKLPLPTQAGGLTHPDKPTALTNTGSTGGDADSALKHCREHFPHLPYCHPATAAQRAIAHRGSSGWTTASRTAARNEFLLRASVLVFILEVVVRDELLRDPRCAVKDAADNVIPGAVRVFCPACDCCDHVRVPPTTGKSGYNVHTKKNVST